MSDKLNPKLINFLGSAVLLFYVGLLKHNDTMFVLEQYETNQRIFISIYTSIIVAILSQQRNIVLLPLNFYYLTIIANILMFGVRHLSSNGSSKLIWIGLYSLTVACLWYSVVIIYHSKLLIEEETDNDYISDTKNGRIPKKKRGKKMIRSRHGKMFGTVKKLKKQQKESKESKGNRGIFIRLSELHRVMIRNCVICNVLWHTLNISMLINKYMFNQDTNNDNLLDIMWIYWTLEYINYQTKIITVDNNIIAPYILIISLLISYDMFILLRICCVIICLSMISYKLSMIIYNVTINDMKEEENEKPNVVNIVYLTQNGEYHCINDQDLTELVESLPLDYFFCSLFSSFGVIMAPSIISVFWRVWHIIPLLINGYGPRHVSGADPVCSCDLCLYQKSQIVLIQFIQSMFVMYVVVKEYRLYVNWKYYKIFDIYSTLFVFALHTVIAKLPFVIFTVCFFKYFVYGSKSCMNHEDELNPEMGTIKPPTPVLLIFYISFVINCWVVYYKFLWKNGQILYKSIRLSVQYTSIRSNFHLMDLFHENHFNVLLFHKFDSLKIHVAGLWVHFCGRVFSVFRDDTTIEIIHVVTSMVLVISAAYHHISWQKGFNNQKFQKVGYFGFCFIFACLATLMFKLYVITTISETVLGYYGILRDSWKHIRNIHIT